MASFAPLSTWLFTQEFTTRAHAIAEMTAKAVDAFVENGLHPRTFDIARDLIQQLDAVEHAAWRAAASLGRTHRTKVLPSSPQQRLLAPPEADDQHNGILGIERLARLAGRHPARTENRDRQEASLGG